MPIWSEIVAEIGQTDIPDFDGVRRKTCLIYISRRIGRYPLCICLVSNVFTHHQPSKSH